MAEREVAQAAARVAAFLDERRRSKQLDPDLIIGFNLETLTVSDLRTLVAAVSK